MADASSQAGKVSAAAEPMSAVQAAFFAQEAPVFAAFAQQFSLDPDVVYLMAAQKGSLPVSVRKRYQEGLDQIARDPYPVHLEPPATTRARIAHGYGASVDEIAISRNTTDALSQILMGIEWRRGDEILVSPMEHPAGISTVLRMSAIAPASAWNRLTALCLARRQTLPTRSPARSPHGAAVAPRQRFAA